MIGKVIITTPSFVVIQTGVYYHKIYGPFNNEGEARIAAKKLIDLEPDDYHRMVVVRLQNKTWGQPIDTLQRVKQYRGKEEYHYWWHSKLFGSQEQEAEV